jgi:spermidine synthase
LFSFHRIVGIELNAGIYHLITRRFRDFVNLDKIPGLEIHQDEGRSYLSRTPERFDVIQASMVDTWAATSAGAMTLSENSLYTVDAWRIFYRHLSPGGLITFTRWNTEVEKIQTSRLFALAWATLLSEGVAHPGSQIALLG